MVALLILARVANEQRVVRRRRQVHLRHRQVVPERLRERPLFRSQYPVGIDDREVVAPVPLVGAEEVRLVLDDRPADRTADLRLAERLLVDAELILEERLRIQLLVAADDDRAAGEGVRAALGDDVHHAANRPAELRTVALRGHLVFLNRLSRVLLEQPADDAVVVVAAVDVDDHRAAGHAAVADAADFGLGRIVVVRRPRAGHQQRQILELAAVERHVLDHRRGDDLADVGLRRLHQRRFTADGHRFRQLADLHREVDRCLLAHLDRNVPANLLGKPLEFHRELVTSRRQRFEVIRAGGAAHCGARQARRRILRRDRGAGNHTLVLVEHTSVNDSRVGLRCGRRDDGQDRGQCREQLSDPHETSFTLRQRWDGYCCCGRHDTAKHVSANFSTA